MSERPPVPSQKMEEKLNDLYYSAVSPDPAFAGRLRAQLLDRAGKLPCQDTTRPWGFRSALKSTWRWGISLAGLGLLVAMIVFSVGLLPRSALSPAQPSLTGLPVMANSTFLSTATPYALNNTVRVGDTWSSIAEMYGLTLEELWALNGVDDKTAIRIGQVLTVGLASMTQDTPGIHPDEWSTPVPPSEALTSTPIPTFGEVYVTVKPDQGFVSLRNGPGFVYLHVGELFAGDRVRAKGKSHQDDWILVENPEVPEGEAWVSAFQVDLEKDDLPVVAPVATPSPDTLVVSPQSCAASIVLPTAEGFYDRPPRALGGDVVQRGNFTFNLWLLCDSGFGPQGEYLDGYSEIAGLGIYAAWFYNGSDMEGNTKSFWGFDPYIRQESASGPTVKSSGSDVYVGIQFPPYVFADLSGPETPLRFVYKIQAPDGKFYGVALSFTLRSKADGYQPVDIQVTALTGKELTDEPASPTSTPSFPTRAWTEIHPLLQEIQDLKARSNETLLNGSGWVHLTSKNTSRQETWTLPNGATVPPETLEDSWYLLNDSLQVVALVTRILDLTGNTLQVSVLENDVSYNLTLDIEFKLVQTFFINLDYGFPETAARAVKMGGSFTKHEIPLDGESTGWQYVIQDEHWKKVAVYDPQTGQLLSLESWSKNAIGEETLESSTTILTYERVAELPTDIRSYFQEEHKAYRPLPAQGTPTPPGFDPSESELAVRTIAGDDANQPNFWYGDIYADGYLLGRVDFGALPGGQCDRSADGSKLAFTYAVVENGTLAQAGLRWFDLRNIEDIHAPAPDLELLSPVAWAQQGDWSAFFACKPDKSACGLYLLDTITDQVRLVTDAGFSTIFPLWEPDGTQISFVNNVDDIYTLLVVDVITGEIVYRGAFDVDAWRVPSDAPTNQWGVEIPRGYTQDRCFQTQ